MYHAVSSRWQFWLNAYFMHTFIKPNQQFIRTIYKVVKKVPPSQRQKVVIPCKESQTKTCTDIKPMSNFSPSQWPAEVVHGHLCHCNKYHLWQTCWRIIIDLVTNITSVKELLKDHNWHFRNITSAQEWLKVHKEPKNCIPVANWVQWPLLQASKR